MLNPNFSHNNCNAFCGVFYVFFFCPLAKKTSSLIISLVLSRERGDVITYLKYVAEKG